MPNRMKKKPDGVFFDFHGTLVTMGDMRAAWTDWLDVFYMGLVRLGLSLSKAAFGQCCDGFSPGTLAVH